MENVKASMVEVGQPQIKVYKRRWAILFLYFLALVMNAVPFMNYSVLADVITEYYGITNEVVEWTVLVYNATAIVLTVPGAYVLDKYGLRPSVLVASVLTAAGLWLRVLGSWPHYWWAALGGQAVVAIGASFIVSAPTRVAAVWFPAKEVSSAIGASVIGNIGGICIGTLVAPLTARATWTYEDNLRGFLTLNIALSVGATILLVAVFFLFEESPPLPPSPEQAAAASVALPGNFFKSMRAILKQPSFILLLICFNIMVSVFYAVTTLLNRDIVQSYPERVSETGYLATILSLAGVVATFVFGIILDKTKKFKELSFCTYLGALVSVVAYSVCIDTTSMDAMYGVAVIMGAFMTSYFVPAYELGVELTYPEPEGNPTSLLLWSQQVISMVTTLAYSRIFSTWGPQVAHGVLVALVAVGCLLTLFIPKRYLRQQAAASLGAKEALVDTPLP